MKKYLLTLSAILMLLVAGCEMFPPDNSQIAPVVGEAPEISISTPAAPDSDSAFTVTIVPAAGTGFYAYLITDEKAELDGAALLAQDYEGLYGGLEDAAKTESVTVSANAKGGIMPGSLYYIYAVGASQEQGNPSAVVYDSVYTTNGNVPIFDDEVAFAAAADGSYVDFALNDVVTRGKGNIYYNVFNPYNAASIFKEGKIVVPKDSLLISGKVVRFKVPSDVPHGALINITWDQGAFVNSAGKEANAYGVCKLGVGTYPPLNAYSAYGKYGDGIIFRKATTTWTISYPNKVVKDDKGKESLVSTAEDTIGLVDLAKDGFVFLTDSTVAGKSQYMDITYLYQDNSERTYPTSAVRVLTDSTILIGLSEVPDKGTWMSINIPAGALRDAYGNTNAAFSSNDNFIYSFGWKMEDIYGTYSNAFGITPDDKMYPINGEGSQIVINPVTDKDTVALDGCNIVIENLLYKGTKIYAAFGKDDGLISIPAGQHLSTFADSIKLQGYKPIYAYDTLDNGQIDTTVVDYEKFLPETILYDYNTYGQPITLQIVAPGEIQNVNPTWINYDSRWSELIVDGNTIVGYYFDVVATIMQRDQPAAVTDASLRKSAVRPRLISEPRSR